MLRSNSQPASSERMSLSAKQTEKKEVSSYKVGEYIITRWVGIICPLIDVATCQELFKKFVVVVVGGVETYFSVQLSFKLKGGIYGWLGGLGGRGWWNTLAYAGLHELLFYLYHGWRP